MRNFLHMIRVTVVGGLLFMVPVVLIILILEKALDFIRAALTPILEKSLIVTSMGVGATKIIVVVLFVMLCFIAGLLARTITAKKIINWLETALLSNLPGYSLMKNVGEEVVGGGVTQQYQSVLARFDDAWQIGFLVERMESGLVVVFIPGSPSPWSGSTYIFDESRITLIDEATNSSIRVLQKLGAGTSSLVKGKISGAVPDNA